MNHQELLSLTEIPAEEKENFKQMIRDYRKNHLRDTKEFAKIAFNKHRHELKNIKKTKSLSPFIHKVREEAYHEFHHR